MSYRTLTNVNLLLLAGFARGSFLSFPNFLRGPVMRRKNLCKQ